MKYFDRFAIAGRIYFAAFVLIAALAGVTVAAFRLLAIRAVARRALSAADRESADAAEG